MNPSEINLESILSLFQEEIHVYKSLLELENMKKTFINSADGKELERTLKQSNDMMIHASELERIRMKSLEDWYTFEKKNMPESGITLTHFLNSLDRESGHKLKSTASVLKTTVLSLKEAVILNDKLLKSRKDFLNTTIDAMRDRIEVQDSTYKDSNMTKQTKTRPLMVNARV